MNMNDVIHIQDYHVRFCSNFDHLKNEVISKYDEVVVLCDENTHIYCFPILEPYLPENHLQLIIAPGEQNKNIVTCKYIWSKLLKYFVNRKALMILCGGGVVGDLGGFVAATYKRGVDFVNIPTSLMSMTDSSIGGKLGIDMMSIKNAVGLFKNPKAVYIHTPFLSTLPDEELKSGYYEMIKHGLIADRSLFNSLEVIQDKSQPFVSEDQIKRSILVKKELIERDPFESGVRKALNFGHTIGHGIESCKLKKNEHITHGEAVCYGMIAESFISNQLKLLNDDDLNRIVKILSLTIFENKLQNLDLVEVQQFIQNDKKAENKELMFSLLKSIGAYSINQPVFENLIEESIIFLKDILTQSEGNI